MGVARWIGGRRAVLPLTARILCARTVRESGAFFYRELLRPSGTYLYTLRKSPTRVAVRHAGSDAATLAEIFYHRYYDAPEPVASVLGEPREILDLGANIGLFGALALTRWPTAHVLAFEPEPASAELHERTISVNELGSSWELVRAAAGTAETEVLFASGLGVGSHVLEARATPWYGTITVPMHDVLPKIAAADLVKMDIEGGEWNILGDPRFAERPPPVLVLEYHPRFCPGGGTQESAERLLTKAGLQTTPIWRGRDGHGMMWAWRL